MLNLFQHLVQTLKQVQGDVLIKVFGRPWTSLRIEFIG